MNNQYSSVCYVCGKEVREGKGQIERSGRGTWQVRHNECESQHYLKLAAQKRRNKPNQQKP